MLTLMTPLRHPDTIVNCQQVVAQVTSIFCLEDVLEVTRSGRSCLLATWTSLFNTQRSNLNEVSLWVTFCVSIVSGGDPEIFSEYVWTWMQYCRFSPGSQIRRHQLCVPLPQGMGRLHSVCWILTDTVCDLQRQAEQMLVMRSPWVPGLCPTFKPDLSLSYMCTLRKSTQRKSQGNHSNLMQEKDEGERHHSFNIQNLKWLTVHVSVVKKAFKEVNIRIKV